MVHNHKALTALAITTLGAVTYITSLLGITNPINILTSLTLIAIGAYQYDHHTRTDTPEHMFE